MSAAKKTIQQIPSFVKRRLSPTAKNSQEIHDMAQSREEKEEGRKKNGTLFFFLKENV